MDTILSLVGRTAPLFEADIAGNEQLLSEIVRESRHFFAGKS